MKEAMFWTARDGGAVACGLCHHRCVIRPGSRGACRVRENRDGRLYSLVYGQPIAQAVDPVEKKPLYHFLPGTATFSLATRGCNFRCLNCQNCRISQVAPDERIECGPDILPEQLVAEATAYGCPSISYTYTEPTVFFEYALETARIATDRGLKNIFVTNGYITPEALREIRPCLHAANVDLKFFDDAAYRRVCGARLQPVLDTIRLYRELGIWIEITTLVIPEHNDSDAQLRGIAEFIAGLDAGIPWHVTGFHPMHRLTDVPATGLAVLRRARTIAREAGLRYVYIGNLPDDEGGTTRCPGCGEAIVMRSGFRVRRLPPANGACPKCERTLEGVWS
jgi:pyruvate formate lyase activating enzyme